MGIDEACFNHETLIENQNLFTAENLDQDYLNEEEYFLSTEGGWYQTFATLVTKYGLVPSNYMPETHDSLSSNRLNILLQEKLRTS